MMFTVIKPPLSFLKLWKQCNYFQIQWKYAFNHHNEAWCGDMTFHRILGLPDSFLADWLKTNWMFVSLSCENLKDEHKMAVWLEENLLYQHHFKSLQRLMWIPELVVVVGYARFRGAIWNSHYNSSPKSRVSLNFAERWIGLFFHLGIDIWSWMGHFRLAHLKWPKIYGFHFFM